MSINLDEIIAGSNSVDDVIAALTENQKANQGTAAQLSQLAEAAKGSFNPLHWIKNNASVGSTVDTVGSEQDYRRHQIEAQENGETPMSREEFNRMRKKMRDSEKQQQSKDKNVRG